MKIKIVIIIVLVAGFAASVHAVQSVLVFAPSFTVSKQGAAKTNSTTGVITFAAPVKTTIGTNTLLKLMAVDEFYEGNYTNVSFPNKAQLECVIDEDTLDNYFIVTDKAGNFLCDVSDLFSLNLDPTGVNVGDYNPVTTLSKSITQGCIGEIIFNDDDAGGSTEIKLFGEVTFQISDTPKTGYYTEKVSGSVTYGIGNGTFGGSQALLTGSATIKGGGIYLIP